MYDFYDFTEFSNIAGIKLLLKDMAEAFHCGGLHQGDEGEANQYVNLLIRPCMADHSTEKSAEGPGTKERP